MAKTIPHGTATAAFEASSLMWTAESKEPVIILAGFVRILAGADVKETTYKLSRMELRNSG